MDAQDVTLAVLAGGASSRMGQSKSALRVRGEPILYFLRKQLDWPGPTLLVTAPEREHPPGAEGFDSEVADPVAGEGPLRGVLTALQAADTEMLVMIAVDMVGVCKADLEWFVERLTSDADASCVMGRRDDAIEPLPCAIRRSAASLVEKHLLAGRRALHGLTADPHVRTIDASALPPRVWTNVNTPAEWDAFLESLGE